jgi:hypothetical protein
MLGQIVVRDLGQILLQSIDHQLRDRLGELLLELGQHARRRDEHELVELSASMLGVELLGDKLDEVLLGGGVQIAARLDGMTRRSRALLDPRRAVAPEVMRALMQLR